MLLSRKEPEGRREAPIFLFFRDIVFCRLAHSDTLYNDSVMIATAVTNAKE